MNVSPVGTAAGAAGPYTLSAVSGFGASPFGGLAPFGSFGPPFFIGIAPPPPLLLPYGSAGVVQAGTSLRSSGGSPVSAGVATDPTGARVITATLNTDKGGIIGFQSTPPAGLGDGTGPGRPGALPSLTDANGQPVPYAVGYDRQGGAVLQIQLSDRSGTTTTLYAPVDSAGFPFTDHAAAA
jgi:hypothetical protein